MPKVLFIHTLSSLIETFNQIAAEQMPSVERTHILDEPLLSRIRDRGTITDDDVERLQEHIDLAEEVDAGAVLVTCSTLS
ncbi:MAG: Asp/Glu/hydantoin racemase, partial [bacterium]|nr:Asp/Glu/hydantoin racemase [bacterium]